MEWSVSAFYIYNFNLDLNFFVAIIVETTVDRPASNKI